MSRADRRRHPARRGPAVPAAAAADWRATARAAEAWRDIPLLGEDDLERVRDFLGTRRAPRLHEDLAAWQRDLLQALDGFDWAAVDAPSLLALTVTAAALRHAREHKFPPRVGADQLMRWRVLLYWLILEAEGAGLQPLALARRAVLAELSSGGAFAELTARADRHLGFDAAALALLRLTGEDRVSGDARGGGKLAERLRAATAKHLPADMRRTTSRDELDAVITEEIVRRLRKRGEHGLLDAVFESLPSGIDTASSWDYVARDAAQRLRREAPRPAPAAVDPTDRPADEPPDRVAALLAVIKACMANPRLAAALEAETTPGSRSAAARKLGRSQATLRRAIADLRKEFKPFRRDR